MYNMSNYIMDEIDEIKENYESGKFDHIKNDLVDFITKYKNDIKAIKSDTTVVTKFGNITDEVAIKLFILKHRSINPMREIKEQLAEMEREKWIKGVQTGKDPNSQQVAEEWAKLYSPGWRDHRVLSIIYVFERDKEKDIRMLN